MFHQLAAVALAAGALAGPADVAVRHEQVATVASPGANSLTALGAETWFTTTNVRASSVSALGAAHTVVAGPLTLGNLSAQLTADARTGTVYVVNRGVRDKKPSVSVVAAATREVKATVPVGSETVYPNGIAVHEDSGRVFVALEDGTVQVLAGQQVVATVPVGRGPDQVVVNGGHVYVSNLADNSVSVLNAGTAKVVATLPVGANPRGLVADEAGHRVHVLNQDNGTVSTINTDTNKIEGEAWPAGSAAGRAAFDPGTGLIYAVRTELGEVAVLDPAQRKAVGSLAVTTPSAVAVNPVLGTVNVVDSGKVQVFARFAPPVVRTHPADVTAATGTVLFTAAARGAVGTRWQESVDGGRSWADVPGATGAELPVRVEQRLSGRAYRAVFTNPTGSTPTTAAVLTVSNGQTTTPATTSVPPPTTTTTTPPPVPTTSAAPPVPRLANTGADPFFPLLTGLALLAAGTTLLVFHHRTKKRENT
ncbi:YVTN family beta-propeller protein [Crossiella equi]|uniref:YVTN family beta-propeller protein n=1 Tax=Crossiella equi TaxID=130796 RepID=A0ABS5AFM2_9PSEU|nr:YncE family protein [Crossiella equi]MBP2474999.1 YVTN family beta-propeller protein [Crossiella equi]